MRKSNGARQLLKLMHMEPLISKWLKESKKTEFWEFEPDGKHLYGRTTIKDSNYPPRPYPFINFHPIKSLTVEDSLFGGYSPDIVVLGDAEAEGKMVVVLENYKGNLNYHIYRFKPKNESEALGTEVF